MVCLVWITSGQIEERAMEGTVCGTPSRLRDPRKRAICAKLHCFPIATSLAPSGPPCVSIHRAAAFLMASGQVDGGTEAQAIRTRSVG